MNEEALRDSYNLFVAEGYEGSIEEFSSLLSSNPEALKDSYSLFQREGYEQPIEDYEMLIGVKKRIGFTIGRWFFGATYVPSI